MTKQMMSWVCVYDPWDGSPLVRVTSNEVDFNDLPDDGIQGFMKHFNDGRRESVSGFDWYIYAPHPDGTWILSGNNHGLEDNQRRYPGCILKRGKLTTDDRAAEAQRILFEWDK